MVIFLKKILNWRIFWIIWRSVNSCNRQKSRNLCFNPLYGPMWNSAGNNCAVLNKNLINILKKIYSKLKISLGKNTLYWNQEYNFYEDFRVGFCFLAYKRIFYRCSHSFTWKVRIHPQNDLFNVKIYIFLLIFSFSTKKNIETKPFRRAI
jgi:hypothetical protein